MNMNEAKLKQAAEQKYQASTPMRPECGEALGTQSYRPSPADEAARNAVYHSEQSMKHSRAADFFQTNPAFSDFVELIRSGAIQI